MPLSLRYTSVVSLFGLLSVLNTCRHYLDNRNTSIEHFAGILGEMLRKNYLPDEIIEFIRYHVQKNKLNGQQTIVLKTFHTMLKAGMTFYCNTKMANILECELTVFANMLEMLNIYEVRKEIKVEFQSFFVNYIASYSENRNVVLNMANFYLGNIDLSGAYLGNTVLVGADIARADIAGADMRGAHLTGAHLTGADLTRVNLKGANLAIANLTRANLTRVYLAEADMEGADLTRADLARANLAGANLTRANLPRADLTGANLKGANLTSANLAGANLTSANLAGANLTGVNLEEVNLEGANLEGTILHRNNL